MPAMTSSLRQHSRFRLTPLAQLFERAAAAAIVESILEGQLHVDLFD